MNLSLHFYLYFYLSFFLQYFQLTLVLLTGYRQCMYNVYIGPTYLESHLSRVLLYESIHRTYKQNNMFQDVFGDIRK